MATDDQGVIRKAPMSGRRFYAVDLDGTLAQYDRYRGRDHIGEPVPAMVERVKGWLAEGHVVIIFTSRVADPTRDDHDRILSLIHQWTEQHIGERLWTTATKQPWYYEIWDNDAVRVQTNTGELFGIPA